MLISGAEEPENTLVHENPTDGELLIALII